ncbi:MAG: hypothetical protein ACYC6Y_15255 [Thermoguttaceae bacterium]
MLIRGRVENGVIVLLDGATLPEGTQVLIEVVASPDVPNDTMTEEEHKRMLEELDRIAALPIEGDPEPFSGADHDQVLYRNP